MKVVHNRIKSTCREADLLKASQLEKDGDLDKAAATYEKITKYDPACEDAYDRLMVIYRKQKQFDKELATINTAIKTFEKFNAIRMPGNRKVSELSRAILKSTGLADKKGRLLYQPEPLGRWTKRKQTVLKKIG